MIKKKSTPASTRQRIVFAVTTNGKDVYTAMTRVSVASIRISNPDAKITIVCDQNSGLAMQNVKEPLLEEVDEYLLCETPSGDANFRNRYIKTSLRKVINGPFLFLDSDTFVRGDLSPLFALDADIAVAPNHSRDTLDEQIWEKDAAILKATGWRIGTDTYFNGGVIFYNDTPKALQFSENWHHLWELLFKQRKYYRDQPSLNAALSKSPATVKVLPHKFNAQIQTSPAVAVDAIIWHSYSSNGSRPSTAFEAIAQKVLNEESLDLIGIKSIISRRHPWRQNSLIDNWIANMLIKKGSPDCAALIWLKGQRKKAIKRLVRDIVFR
jgi:lipopolysaccharide biosynthesis glycosyltransferase